MGISTLQSYQGAQIFEVLGIAKAVEDRYFCGSVSHIGGLSLDDIATGDMRHGLSLVVWAIAEGRKATASLHDEL